LGKLEEPPANVRRVACGSRAAVWPPLLYVKIKMDGVRFQ